MKIKTKLFLFFLILLNSPLLFAQSDQVDMADGLRSNGKIYVVVTVLCIVFAGIVTFLIMTDRKISSLEKKLDNGNK